MRLLGIDYGHRRIGLAYADELGVATPLPAAVEAGFEERMEHISRAVAQRGIGKLIVGYPYNMDGSAGEKTKEVDAFIAILRERFKLPVETADERLSSFQAECDLGMLTQKHKKSLSARKRHRKSGDIDSRAAALILQDWLDNEAL